jgi:thioredoxin reductase
VERLDEVASDSNLMHRRALLLELAKTVKIRTGLTCCEITNEGVVAAGADGERTVIPADTVVVAVGYRPLTEVVDALVGTAPEFMTIGDCVRPRRLLNAIRMGYDAGMAV